MCLPLNPVTVVSFLGLEVWIHSLVMFRSGHSNLKWKVPSQFLR